MCASYYHVCFAGLKLSSFCAHAGMGFCSHELNFVTENPDRGTYNWNETEVGGSDVQHCGYEPVSKGGMAIRNCIANDQWAEYDGRQCVTFATFRLRNISRVSRKLSDKL